jgi:hypothetical protein
MNSCCFCLFSLATCVANCAKSFLEKEEKTIVFPKENGLESKTITETKIKSLEEPVESKTITETKIKSLEEPVESKTITETKTKNLEEPVEEKVLNRKEKKQKNLEESRLRGEKWKKTFNTDLYNSNECCTLEKRFNLTGSTVYCVVQGVYDADTITVAIWAYECFTVFKLRLARIDSPEMKNQDDKKNPVKYKSKKHELIEKLLENECKKIARNAKQFVVNLCSYGKISYNTDVENITIENNRVDNLFLNNKPSVLSVKITEYEAKFGRQIAEVYTLDDPNVSINDKLLENGLVYKYNGGTKLTFYEQISTLKGEEYVINLINSSNIMTHKDYIN